MLFNNKISEMPIAYDYEQYEPSYISIKFCTGHWIVFYVDIVYYGIVRLASSWMGENPLWVVSMWKKVVSKVVDYTKCGK